MTKQSYDVDENSTSRSRPKNNTSYKSFVCALLVFLVICLIILLTTLNLGGDNAESSKEDDKYEVLQTYGNKSTQTHEKIIKSTESTTTRKNRGKSTAAPTTTEPEKSTKTSEAVLSTDSNGTTIPVSVVGKGSSVPPATTENENVSNGSTIFGYFDERDSTVQVITVPTSSSKGSLISDSIDERAVTVPVTTTEEDDDTKIVVPLIANTSKGSTISDPIDERGSTVPVTTTEKENISKTVVLSPTNISEGSTISDSIEVTGSTVPDTTTEEENATTIVVPLPTNISKGLTISDFINKRSSTIRPTTTELGNVTKIVVSTLILNGSTVSDSVDEIGSTVPPTTTEKENVTKAAVPISSTNLNKSQIAVPSTTNDNNVSTSTDTVFRSSTEIIASTSTAQELISDSLETSMKSLIPVTTSTKSTTIEKVTDELNNTKREVTPDDTQVTKIDPVCRSEVCNEKASHIICKMNHSATACEDFYDFACGGTYQIVEESDDVKDAELLLSQLNSVNSPDKYVNDFKNFYYSCLQYEDYFNYNERMEGVKKLLAAVGKFQLDSREQFSTDGFTDLISKLILRQSMPLFEIGLDVNKHTTNLVLQLTLPEQSTLKTGLKDWSGLSLHKKQCLKKQGSVLHGTHLLLENIYESYRECQSNCSIYINSVENVLLEFDAFVNLIPKNRTDLIRHIRFDIEFEILNKLLFPSPTEVHFYKVTDLQHYYSVLNWKRLFETLTGRQIKDDTLVQVHFKYYFDQLFKSLSVFAKTYVKLKNAFLAVHAYDLYVNTVVPKEQSNRELFCFDLSKKLLPDVWAYLTQSLLSNNKKDYQNRKVTDLFTKLQREFCKYPDDDDWMDDDTKNSFLSKCYGLNLVLFEPPSKDSLRTKYEHVSITGDYQIDLINLLTHYKKNVYATEGTPFSNTTIFSYFLDPLSTKSLTLYSSNLIAVPAGLMRKVPKDLPNYLVMATIGFDLAKQMTRHFDPTGINYNFALTTTSNYSYVELIKTYEDMQKSFSTRMLQHKNITFKLTGVAARNDMIVDNAAFKLISDTLDPYRREDEDMLLPWIGSTYSKEQLFFVAVAQEFCKKTTVLDFMLQVFERGHLPQVLKVENIMSNSPSFSKHFNCKPGSGMNQFLDSDKLMQFPHLIQIESDYD